MLQIFVCMVIGVKNSQTLNQRKKITKTLTRENFPNLKPKKKYPNPNPNPSPNPNPNPKGARAY